MRKLLIFAMVILGAGGLIVSLSVAAQAPPLQYPEALSLSATTDTATASGRFTVTAGKADVTNLQFTPSPLTDADGKVAVAAEAVIVDPAQPTLLKATTSLTVAVSIANLPAPGRYEGNISIAYAEQLTDTVDAILLTLIVEQEAVVTEPETGPALHIEPVGEPLHLQLKADGTNYHGSIAVTSLVTGEITDLKLTNFSDLNPTAGEAPSIMRADVQALNDLTSQTLAPGETKHLIVTCPKPSLAGTYTGTVEITYKDKPLHKKYEIELELNAALPEITIEPQERILTLKQKGKSGPYKATFSLRVKEGEVRKVSNVKFTKSELYRTNGKEKPPIFPDEITITPDSATFGPGDPPVKFTVSVESNEEGTYEGTLYLSYSGSDVENALRTVPLTLGLTVSPEASLTVVDTTPIQIKATLAPHGLRGFLDVQVTREPMLQETTRNNDVTITAETFNPGNLLDKKPEQERSLPNTVVVVNWPAGEEKITVPRGKREKLPLLFDFGIEGVQAGEFSGKIFVESDSAPTLEIPVEVTLKDHWCWPMLIMCIGIFVGLALSWYQSEQRAKDKLLVTIGDLQDRLADYATTTKRAKQPNVSLSSSEENEVNFYKFYGETAEKGLGQAKQILDLDLKGGLQQATTLVENVQSYWPRWTKYGAGLWEQKGRAESLSQLLGDISESYEYARRIKANCTKITAERADYANDNDMKQAIDTENQRYEDLIEVIHKRSTLEEALNLLKADEQPNLEAQIAAGFRDRIDDQLKALKEADEDAKIQAIKEALNQIESDLEAAYQAYPHFYYHEYHSEARGLIEGISDGGHWPIIKKRLNDALNQADSDYKRGMNFERDSRLAHNTWRAAWFYKHVIIPTRQELKTAPTSPETQKNLWDAVRQAVEVSEQGLAHIDYGKETEDNFDGKLLTWMETIYQKLGQAKQQPIADVPFLPTRKTKPYRDFDEILDRAREPSEAYGLESLPPTPFQTITASAPGVLVRDTKERLKRFFMDVGKSIVKIVAQVFGDPRYRLRIVEAILTLILLATLAYFGMQGMWINDATFGDNGIFDYIAVAFFGFAANATKDSMISALKAVGLETLLPGQ